MMKLSLMNKVVNTLTADNSSPLAAKIAEMWFSDVDSIKYLRASANFVFEINTKVKDYILRFNSVTEKELQSVEDEVAVLKYLLENGLKVYSPIQSQKGRYLEVIQTDLGVFIAIMYEKIKGKIIEIDQMDDQRIILWGSKLGELHNLSKSIPQDIVKNRLSWKIMFKFVRQYISKNEQILLQEYKSLRDRLQDIPVNNENFGLIHFDFDIDNILWNNQNEITIIDFDDMVKLWFGADILYAVRSLFYNKPLDLKNHKFKLFMQGYKSITSFDDKMLDYFPDFLRLHRLFFIARLRRSLDIKDTSNYPTWVEKLTNRIKQNYIDSSIEDIKTGKLTVR